MLGCSPVSPAGKVVSQGPFLIGVEIWGLGTHWQVDPCTTGPRAEPLMEVMWLCSVVQGRDVRT